MRAIIKAAVLCLALGIVTSTDDGTQNNTPPIPPEDDSADWGIGTIRDGFEAVNGYFDSFLELLGGRNGVCQYKCRYGKAPLPRPDYKPPEPNGCSSYFLGLKVPESFSIDASKLLQNKVHTYHVPSYVKECRQLWEFTHDDKICQQALSRLYSRQSLPVTYYAGPKIWMQPIEDGSRDEDGGSRCRRRLIYRLGGDYRTTFSCQLDMGIPAMTKCCNQLDICYDTCGANKYRCDAKFRWCLHSICSDLKKSLGFVSKVEACESVADTVFNTVWALGCRPFMNSQRASCICNEEERDEL